MADQTSEGGIWGEAVIVLDSKTEQYTWKGYQGMESNAEDKALLMLEQLFYAPLENPCTFPYALAAQVQAKRHVKIDAEKELAHDKEYQAASETAEACNWSMSNSLVGMHPGIETNSNLEQYQIQEWRRFKNPLQPFQYVDPGNDNNTYQVMVGPVIQNERQPKEMNVLVPSAPPEVTILNLVNDSLARLPNSSGSRTDIRHMLRQSQ